MKGDIDNLSHWHIHQVAYM